MVALVHGTRTRAWRDGRVVAENFPPSEVSDYLAQEGTTVWMDECEPDESDLAAIAEELGLHPLAVEDAVHEHQRPKIDHYPSHMFMTAYQAYLDPDTNVLAKAEVAAFITANALVTVRKSEGFDIDAVVGRWDEADPELARSGVAFLIHGLLDFVVDTQYTTMDKLDSAVDGLEDALFGDAPTDQTMQRQTFELRKSLVDLRRVVLPMREVVNTLLRRDLRFVDETVQPYFQDVYDHVLRISEQADSLRDMIANIYDTQLNLRSNRINVMMKQVTSWAAIAVVPTAVTGWYGMNVPYWGFGHKSGLYWSIGILLGLSGALYLLFKRKGWL